MIIPSYSKQAVRRECLAMHSELSAFGYISSITEICKDRLTRSSFVAFTSPQTIFLSCGTTFCTEMKRWESSHCQGKESHTPMQRCVLEQTDEKHSDTKETLAVSGELPKSSEDRTYLNLF